MCIIQSSLFVALINDIVYSMIILFAITFNNADPNRSNMHKDCCIMCTQIFIPFKRKQENLGSVYTETVGTVLYGTDWNCLELFSLYFIFNPFNNEQMLKTSCFYIYALLVIKSRFDHIVM